MKEKPQKPRMLLRPGLKWIIPCGFFLVLVLFFIFNALFLDILSGVSFSRTYFDRSGKLLNIFLTSDDK
ncbi:MAG: hypothetical protein LBG91_00070, partial [Treponema sp.]|nr:hypothetical protein [Treponema sp.]